MSIAILISEALFSRMSVCLFMIVECGVPLAHSTTHDIYKSRCGSFECASRKKTKGQRPLDIGPLLMLSVNLIQACA